MVSLYYRGLTKAIVNDPKSPAFPFRNVFDSSLQKSLIDLIGKRSDKRDTESLILSPRNDIYTSFSRILRATHAYLHGVKVLGDQDFWEGLEFICPGLINQRRKESFTLILTKDFDDGIGKFSL